MEAGGWSRGPSTSLRFAQDDNNFKGKKKEREVVSRSF
jgi:hypothetical protein